jgi:succinate dehydrogenase / fumarate reductase cytochrome b subunit
LQKLVKRPKNLNLFSIRFPVPAIVSILHRMSGAFLFILMPIILFTFCYSLNSEDQYDQLMTMMSGWKVNLIKILVVWGLIHHFMAGLRHILLDMQIGNDIIIATLSSKSVLLISLLLTLLFFVF